MKVEELLQDKVLYPVMEKRHPMLDDYQAKDFVLVEKASYVLYQVVVESLVDHVQLVLIKLFHL